MGRVLSEAMLAQLDEEGYTPPVQVLTPEEVARYRAHLEGFEAKYPDHTKKLKSKSQVLCPWVVELAETPRMIDAFGDFVGEDVLLWNMAWRVKKADGSTFAGWHQDFAYGGEMKPRLIIGALALSECGPEQGCLKVIPGSHKNPPLPHQDFDDPTSILARGQQIMSDFDKSKAVPLILKPGEIAFFNCNVIHGSAPNLGPDRRLMCLVEMIPPSAYRTDGIKDTAMLLRGTDNFHNFEEEPRPDAEFSEQALANWQYIIGKRAKMIFQDSTLAVSEAYGGQRAAY